MIIFYHFKGVQWHTGCEGIKNDYVLVYNAYFIVHMHDADDHYDPTP